MKLRDLDIELLMVLQAMIVHRSARRAAEQLGVSQPKVSHALKALRELFGDELFVRTGRGMVPTTKAIALGASADKVLGIITSEILSPAARPPLAELRRVFVISTTDIGEMVFIPPLLEQMRTEAPNSQIRCVNLLGTDLTLALASGDVDLAIGYIPELNNAGVLTQRLFTHPFVALMRDDTGLSSHMSMEEYRAAQHIALTGGGHGQARFEALIEKAGIERNITFRSNNFMNIPFIVRDSGLVATVPKVIAVAFKDMLGLKARSLPFAIPAVPIQQYWHQRSANDHDCVWLRRTVANAFLNNDPTENCDPTLCSNPATGTYAEVWARPA